MTIAKPYEVNSLDSKRDLRKIQDLLASCWHQEHAHSGYGSRVPVWCGCGQSRNSSAAGWPCHADMKVPALRPHITVSVAALGVSENITANVCSRSVCTGVCLGFFLRSLFFEHAGWRLERQYPTARGALAVHMVEAWITFPSFQKCSWWVFTPKLLGTLSCQCLLGKVYARCPCKSLERERGRQ